MNSHPSKFLIPSFVILGSVLAIFALVGCDDSAPVAAKILTTGRVTAGVGSLACEDTSTTIPANLIVNVFWLVRSPSGSTADSETGVAGGEVTFTGLAAGDYSVEQTPILEDGREGPRRTYARTVQ